MKETSFLLNKDKYTKSRVQYPRGSIVAIAGLCLFVVLLLFVEVVSRIRDSGEKYLDKSPLILSNRTTYLQMSHLGEDMYFYANKELNVQLGGPTRRIHSGEFVLIPVFDKGCYSVLGGNGQFWMLDNSSGLKHRSTLVRYGSYAQKSLFHIITISTSENAFSYQISVCNERSGPDSSEHVIGLVPCKPYLKDSPSCLGISRVDRVMFKFQFAHPIRGVNLGGWFVPEFWMNPIFFKDVDNTK